MGLRGDRRQRFSKCLQIREVAFERVNLALQPSSLSALGHGSQPLPPRLDLAARAVDSAAQVAMALKQMQRVSGDVFVEKPEAVALLGRLQEPVDGPLAILPHM